MKLLVLLLLLNTSIAYSWDDGKENRKGHSSQKSDNRKGRSSQKSKEDNFFFRFVIGGRHRSRPPFNTKEIFGCTNSIEDMHVNQKEFLKKIQKVQENIRFHERHLELLLEAHQNGMNKTDEVYETLTKLHTLATEQFKLIEEHSKLILSDIKAYFILYNNNVNAQLSNTNRVELVNNVLDRYTIFLENK